VSIKKPRNRGVRARARGQSTTELLTVSLALVPLFMLMPLIGDYLDMNQQAEMASRYAAFEGAVHNSKSQTGWKSDATLSAEVQKRFFSGSAAPIKTGDVAGNFAADRNPLWTDPSGNHLLEDITKSVWVNTKVDSKNALSLAAFQGAFNLSKDNLYTATVSVKPKNFERIQPFDTLNLQITRRTTILVDTWAARSPNQVASTINNADFAAYPIEPLRLLGNTFGQIPRLFLENGMDVGNINPDIVPCDRLTTGC
jgi:hypothetical protein